jgi:hypothetical protein
VEALDVVLKQPITFPAGVEDGIALTLGSGLRKAHDLVPRAK